MLIYKLVKIIQIFCFLGISFTHHKRKNWNRKLSNVFEFATSLIGYSNFPKVLTYAKHQINFPWNASVQSPCSVVMSAVQILPRSCLEKVSLNFFNVELLINKAG